MSSFTLITAAMCDDFPDRKGYSSLIACHDNYFFAIEASNVNLRASNGFTKSLTV
jgi:hypothetical protein